MSEELYELPDGWYWATLAQVAEIGSEQVLPKRLGEQRVQYIALENVERGTGRLVDFAPTPANEIGSNKFKFTAEHVLYGKLRPYLQKSLVPDFEGISATDLLPLRPDPEILDRRFLWRWLLSYDVLEYVVALQTGVKMPRLRTRDLEAMPVPIPPLAEQRRIVAKIERLFEQSRTAREALDGVPTLMKRFRQSVLASAFRGELTERDPNDEPASALLERIRAERREKFKGKKYVEPEPLDTNDLPELPDGWAWVRAEQICDFITKGTTPASNKLFSGSGEVPFIKVYNLTNDGRLDFTVNPTFISRETHLGELARSRVMPGDVLMNIVGPPLGKISIVPNLYPEWNINQAIAVFRPITGFDRNYLCLALLEDKILEWAKRRAKATAGQFNLTLQICRNLPLPLAPLPEQRRIVAKVEALFAQADTVERAVEVARRRAEKVDQAILARAFRGEL